MWLLSNFIWDPNGPPKLGTLESSAKMSAESSVFTRGHFWPSGIVVACVRPSVRPSVTKFVHEITRYPFKLGSPNLDQRCKRSLLFCGTIDHDLQGQIALQSQNLPHFELVHAITHHQLKLLFPDLEQKCSLALFRSPPLLGLIEIDLQFNFKFQTQTKLSFLCTSLAFFSETS